MYCKNCGKELSDNAAFCSSCGYSVNGAPAATHAPNPAPNPAPVATVSEKSRLIAALLAYFLGVFGGHNFYVGRTGNAVAQLILTVTLIGAVVSGIWAFVDFICILCGTYKDVNGLVVKNWLDNQSVEEITVTKHYDLLIENGNDSVLGGKELQEYMNK